MLNGHKTPIADRIVPARLWTDQPRPAALVPDWLPAQGLAVLYGAPKTGKSLIAVDLAAQATTGGIWCDRKPAVITAALYVAAEAPALLGPRLDAWLEAHDHDDATIDILPEVVHLGSDQAVSELAGHVAASPYPLVIVDTWARCTVGLDENSGRDIGAAVERLLSINPTGLTLCIHHSTKAQDRVLRGHGTLLAALDSAIHVGRRGDTLILTAVEQRSMAPGATASYAISPADDAAVLRGLGAPADIDLTVAALNPGDNRQQWAQRLMDLHDISMRTAQNRIRAAIAAELVENAGSRQRAAYQPRSTAA